MEFWKLAYDRGWIDKDKSKAIDTLKTVVITKENPLGEITPEEFKVITGQDFVA